jgi:hypothetical protein
MDPDCDLHIVEPMRVGRDLQTFALIAHGVVVGDDAVFLHTQHVREIGPDPRDEGSARFACRHRKAPVVGGDELVAEKLIRRRHGGDVSPCQLFGQPILERAEDAFRAASCFRGIRRASCRARACAAASCDAPPRRGARAT